jgi:RNA polymerase sigma-70 factor (sigma-E family)
MPEMTEMHTDAMGGSEPSTREAEPAPGRLAELYERHAGAGLRLAYLLTGGDRSQAEDLLQEAFVRCVGRFRHLRVPDAFDAYLRRAIVNLHTSGLRHTRVERAYEARQRGAPVRVSSMPDVAGRQDLWRALSHLPARQRAALVLRYYEDLSERDTAEVLGCSLPAVKSLIARGAEALRVEIPRGEDA